MGRESKYKEIIKNMTEQSFFEVNGLGNKKIDKFKEVKLG